MPKLIVTVPGKVILAGEHAVVYGEPAVVVAVTRYLHLTASWPEKLPLLVGKNLLNRFPKLGARDILAQLTAAGVTLKEENDIPLGSGMGSSAALSAAVSALVLTLTQIDFDRAKLNEYAYQLEKHFHQNPSGADNTIVINGGVLSYRKTPSGPEYHSVSLQLPKAPIFLIQTGQPDESTGEMVQLVARKRELNRGKVDLIMAAIGAISQSWLRSDLTPDFVVHAFRCNHRLLNQLGVVSAEAQQLIGSIEELGGGAKIAGAGGKKKHSGVILAHHAQPEKLTTLLDQQSLEYFPIAIDQNGINIKYA